MPSHQYSADSDIDSLSDQLFEPQVYPAFVADCQRLVADEIERKGFAVRTAYRVVCKVKPDILDRAVEEILPDFIRELEPCYDDFCNNPQQHNLQAYLEAHDDRVAEAALRAADARADRIVNRGIRSAYDRVRGRAHKEIKSAVPRIAANIARHIETAGEPA